MASVASGLGRLGLALLLLSAPARAQAPLAVPAVPASAGGWVLHVSTGGGIMGNGAGEFALTSDGALQCTARCAASAAGHVMPTLRAQIREAAGLEWLQMPASSLCMDCLVTRVTLTLRNEDGTMTVVRASWDPTTRGKLPAGVVRAVDLAKSAAQPLTR